MNPSGIHPKGYTLLVKPQEIVNKTESGIVLRAPTEADRAQIAQVYGRVIEMGPLCFEDEKDSEGNVIRRCEVGENVIFRRYSGEEFTGEDGLKYRVILDKDVYATRD